MILWLKLVLGKWWPLLLETESGSYGTRTVVVTVTMPAACGNVGLGASS